MILDFYRLIQYSNSILSHNILYGESSINMCAALLDNTSADKFFYYEGNMNHIADCAFAYCLYLESVNMQSCTYVGNSAFVGCQQLDTVNLSSCEYIGNDAFNGCIKLPIMKLSICSYIGDRAFASCSSLKSIYLYSDAVVTLNNVNAFSDAMISNSGYIYVPYSLYNSYKTANNWSYYSNRFKYFT